MSSSPRIPLSRRQFLAAGIASAALTATPEAHARHPRAAADENAAPWFRRTRRWVQTNLNEDDPVTYDPSFWAAYWQRVHAQGVIVNAGGIVAFYPTRHDWHHRAEQLGARDLFGEILEAARHEGLTVLARMDSTRAYEEVFAAHPGWFARDRAGKPFTSGRLYTACVNGPWLTECIPAVLREIAERYHPDGFTDNSWSGLRQDQVCYCPHCEQRFRDATGMALPGAVDWDDRAYRGWIEWSYARRLALWDAHNAVTHDAGGPHCHWMGMLQGDPAALCVDFRLPSGVLSRTPIVMLDWQARRQGEAASANAAAASFVHSVVGSTVLVPESMPLYQGPGAPMFRHVAKPGAEVRLWAVAAFAGGIQPWFHHLGASQRDPRQFEAAGPLGTWHAAHEEFLTDREPAATIGVAWSERSIDWYGRGAGGPRVMQPYYGTVDALVAHRLPWRAVSIDRIDDEAGRLDVLVLPNVAAMSDAQCAAVRRFALAGGGLVASGETSLRNEWGDVRGDFALADLFGVHATSQFFGTHAGQQSAWSNPEGHTYLEFTAPPDALAGSQATAALREGLDGTSLLPFGGRVEVVRPDAATVTVLEWVPPYPASPPEDVRRKPGGTSCPAAVVHGRTVYFAADVDRCYGRDRLPDHAQLIANAVRLVARRPPPITVEGPGLLDIHLHRQPARLILHVVNLTNPAAWRPPAVDVYPVGPLTITMTGPDAPRIVAARCLVSQAPLSIERSERRTHLTLPRVDDHEVIVFELSGAPTSGHGAA